MMAPAVMPIANAISIGPTTLFFVIILPRAQRRYRLGLIQLRLPILYRLQLAQARAPMRGAKIAAGIALAILQDENSRLVAACDVTGQVLM